jgi:hypothetical protein
MQCRPAQEHLPRTQAVVELAGQIAGCGGVYSVAHGEHDAALAGNSAAGKERCGRLGHRARIRK